MTTILNIENKCYINSVLEELHNYKKVKNNYLIIF